MEKSEPADIDSGIATARRNVERFPTSHSWSEQAEPPLAASAGDSEIAQYWLISNRRGEEQEELIIQLIFLHLLASYDSHGRDCQNYSQLDQKFTISASMIPCGLSVAEGRIKEIASCS